MGVAIRDIIIIKEIELDQLNNKIIILDAYNVLYQFLTTIRGIDGAPLTDSKGNITSHLVGLFSRTTSLLQKGIKPVFVFDGKSPKLKQKEQERRNAIKAEAEKKYLEAKKREDKEEMKKYASRTTRLNITMVEESKKLIASLGIPIVQAPSEGEAQAAYMVKENKGFAVGSQDYDSLIHGATKLARNLSITGKKKKARSVAYETIKPELIDLSENLKNLKIDQHQLIALAMIVGTDYNRGGIKGIGPKNALKLVRQHKSNFQNLFKEIGWDKYFDFPWKEVYDLIDKMPTTDDYKLEWKNINNEQINKFLVDGHNFSEQRVKNTLEKLEKETSKKQQKSLGEF